MIFEVYIVLSFLFKLTIKIIFIHKIFLDTIKE